MSLIRSRSLQGLFFSATAGLLLAASGAGCGGDDMPMEDVCTADKVTGTSYKYATNALRLPASSGTKTYASDIDGDGKSENALKTLVQAVSVAGLNLQDPINEAVADGDAVILAELKTTDLTTSSCAGGNVCRDNARRTLVTYVLRFHVMMITATRVGACT